MVADPKEVLCNKCGESMCPLGTMNEIHPHGLHKASVSGGFDSYHLFDMTRYTFSICEKCLRQLFNTFVVPPLLSDIDFDGEVTAEAAWHEDQRQYEYRVWCDNGGHHQAYINRKCNEIKDCPNGAVHTVLTYSQDYSENCCCDIHSENYNVCPIPGLPNNYRLVKFIPHTLKAFL